MHPALVGKGAGTHKGLANPDDVATSLTKRDISVRWTSISGVIVAMPHFKVRTGITEQRSALPQRSP